MFVIIPLGIRFVKLLVSILHLEVVMMSSQELIFTVMRLAMRMSRRFITGIVLLVVFLSQELVVAFFTSYIWSCLIVKKGVKSNISLIDT